MVATLEKTTTEDIYIDITELPQAQRAGHGMTQKMREIPEGKALLVPCTEERRAAIRGNVANYQARLQKELGRQYHCRYDRSRGGFWVWWEAK